MELRSQSISSELNRSRVSDITESYDNLCSLATVDGAKRHLRAKRVRKLIDLNPDEKTPDKLCPCCQLPVPENDTDHCFTWRSDYKEFAELGIAVPMYFSMIWYFEGILAAVLIAAVPNIIGNIIYGYDSHDTVFGILSIEGTGANLRWWNSFLYLLVLVWLCSLFLIAKFRLKWLARDLRRKYSSVADYSVSIKGLGEKWSRVNLMKHIEEKMEVEGVKLSICNITTAYDVKELVEAIEKYEEVCRERAKANHPDLESGIYFTLKSLNWTKDKKLAESSRELGKEEKYQIESEKCQKELEELLSKENLKQTGVAIVSFTETRQAQKFLERWGEGVSRQVMTAFGVHWGRDPALVFNNNPLHVTRAREPFDVLWENLGYTIRQRVFRQMCSSALLLVILCISFGIVIATAIGDGYIDHESYGIVPGTIFGMIVTLVNSAISWAVELTQEWEGHHSHTGQELFTATKVTLVQLINTLFAPLLLEIVVHKYAPGKPTHFASNVSMVCVMNLFWETFRDMASVVIFWWVYKRLVMRQLVLGKTFITQNEANEAVQLPEPEIATWYGETLVKLIFALAYCPYAPVIVPITMVGLFFEYWLKKFFLIKFASKPQELDQRLEQKMIEFVRFGIAAYGISTFFSMYWFQRTIRSNVMIIAMACSIIGFVFCLLLPVPYKNWFKWLLEPRPTKCASDSFTESEFSVLST